MYKMIMDMLHRDKLFSILLIMLLCISCSEKKRNVDTRDIKLFSQNIIGGKVEYQRIYTYVVDTLNNWKINNLFSTSIACKYSNFQVDSLMCFNKEKNRMITCVLESECKDDADDGIKILLGAKIQNKWYFFSGAFIVIPRDMYVSKNKLHEPLSFSKLHEIAMKEVFGGYLKKNDKGEWEINEEFFKTEFEGLGWGDFKNQESDSSLKGKRFKNEKDYYEFRYLEKARNNWAWR